MRNKTQVGWYHIEEDIVKYEYPRSPLCPEPVLIKAGKYPVFINENCIYSLDVVTDAEDLKNEENIRYVFGVYCHNIFRGRCPAFEIFPEYEISDNIIFKKGECQCTNCSR